MRYPQFRHQHLFVGSGVIEAGCRTVIGSRLKQSGMFWTVRGANAIIACDVVTSMAASKIIGRADGGLTSTSMSHTLPANPENANYFPE